MVTRIIKSLKSTKSIAYTRGRRWNIHYELYIDLFFLINFLMDYFLLLMVGKMLKCRIRRLRIIAGAMVGAFLTCIFVVFLRGKIWRLVLFHGVMNMCLLKTGLGIKEKRTLIKAWILLYVSAFLLGGILNVFQPYVRGGAVFLILAFAGYHLCLGIWDLLAYFHKNMAGSCRARLYQNGRECEIYAIIDTGNRLRDSLTGRPVHVITGEIAEKLGCTDFSSKRVITYQSIGKENGTMPILMLDCLCCRCEKEEKWVEKPLVAVSERQKLSNVYDMILNPDDL